MNKFKVLAIAALVFFLAGFALLWHYMPEMMAYARQQILKQAQETVNGALSIEQVRLSGFFKVSADNVKVEDKQGNLVFHSDTVTVSLNVLTFLFNQDQPVKAISTVDLAKGSTLNLHMDEQQVWNVSQLLIPSDESSNSFGALIRLNDVTVNIHLPNGTWPLLANGTVDAAQNPNFAFDLDIKHQDDKIKANGKMNLQGQGRLILETSSLAVESFDKLVQRAIAVNNIGGRLKDVKVIWDSSQNGNVFNGKLGFDNLSGDYNLADNPMHIVLNGGLAIKNNKLDFAGLTTAINEQVINISGGLALTEQTPQALDLTLSAQDFSVRKALQSSPFAGEVNFKVAFDGPLNANLTGLMASGQVHFAEAQVAGVALDHGDIAFTYKDKNLLLNKAQVGIYHGLAEVIGSYDVDKNYLAGNVQLQGVDLSRVPNAQMAGRVGGQLYFSGTPTYEGLNFSANLTSEAIHYRSLAISNLTASAQKLGSVTTLNYLSGNVGTGYFNAQGIVDGAPLDITLQAADLPLQQLLGAFGREASGYLNAKAHLYGSWGNLEGDADMYARDGVVEKQPFKTVKGHFALRDHVLSFANFLLQMNYGVHYLNGSIDLSTQDPGLALTVTSKAVRLEPIAALAVPEEKITGNADSFITLTGTLSEPQASGEILIYEASFRDYFVERLSGRYVYSNDRLQLDNVNVKFMQTSLFLHGSVDRSGALDLAIEGDNVRLESLPQLEDLSTSGGLALNGKLTGTLDNPYFNGTVSSEAVIVNGQVINELHGEAWSEGGTNNYLRVNFKQGQGIFDLDAGIDFKERFAHGFMEVKDGDVNSLLAAAGMPSEIGGLLNGTLTLNSSGRRNGLSVDATIRDAHVREVKFAAVDVNLHLQNGKFTINRLQATQGTGSIVGAGTADLRGELAIELGGNGLDASILTAFMQKPVDFRGNMNFLVQVSGMADNPEVSASLQISPGSVENVTFDNLYGLLSVKDDILNVDQLFVERGEYKISAYGQVPVDLFRLEANRRNPDSQMDLQVHLDNADLSLIPSIFTNEVEWGFGKLEGGLNITGTLQAPRYYGDVRIQNGTLKFHYLRNPLDQINLNAQFNGTQAILQQFNAIMGKGSVSAQGTLDISDFSGSDYNLKIQANQLELASEMVEGPLTCNFEITPQESRSGLRPLIKGDVFLEDITFNLPVVPEFGEGSYNIGLDVTIRTGEKVRLYNRYLYDMLLEGNLHITGSTSYMNIEGTAGVQRGTIKYLNTPFKIESATAGFPIPGSPMPTVNLSARSRIDYVDVYVTIRGPIDEMEVTLTSDPPMSQQEIFRLMTLKTRAAEGSTLTDEDMKSLLAAGLQMTIFGGVEDIFKDAFGIDEFRIYQGPISNGVGLMSDSLFIRHATREEREQFNIYVAKYLTDNILLSYTRSFSDDDYRLGLQYEINRRLSLGASLDEDSNMYYGIEYKISF